MAGVSEHELGVDVEACEHFPLETYQQVLTRREIEIVNNADDQHSALLLAWVPIAVPYPKYKFQYTSAGGNSSQESVIRLDTPTLNALSVTLADKIRWAKSAAGQRALMTAWLRNAIKERDRYACRRCGVSLAAEPHLLLEVDHIVPVSKGGLSTPENLQTLCWRCNRSKGAKIVA
ncbi:MAG: HNH endonuclease [Propionibacteriaceae bacterium]|jgi:hypothetical protein|nr:HNH endonuclease [Propionibacteriaceae bacterium]